MRIVSKIVFSRRAYVLSLALLLCFVVAAPIQATIVAPGPGAFPADVFAGCAGCTQLAYNTTGVVVSSNGKVTFTLNSAVYRDPGNPFAANDLDFVYQVSDMTTSIDSIGRVTGIDFTGFSTDLGYSTAGMPAGGGTAFPTGTVLPQLVDRVSADVVGFSFNAPLSQLIPPGSTSVVLVVKTNATNFRPGQANVIDGGVSTVFAYQPASGVPEPASTLLVGAGLLALAGVRRLRRS